MISKMLTDMPTVHQRKCWDCGNLAWHADMMTPYVLCRKCGSQDTRRCATEIADESKAMEDALRTIATGVPEPLELQRIAREALGSLAMCAACRGEQK